MPEREVKWWGRKWFHREAQKLSERSVVEHVLGYIPLVKGRKLDQVRELRHSPLGMFFYNQRAVFFAFSGIYCIIFASLVWYWTSAGEIDMKYRISALVLCGAWILAVAVNLFLHKTFLRYLERWAAKAFSEDLPPRLDQYFILDFGVLYITVMAGVILQLGFSHLAILLFMNLVIYGTYVGRARGYMVLGFAGALLVLIALLFLAPLWGGPVKHPLEIRLLMSIGPILGTLFATLFTVTIISSLRNKGNQTVQAQLKLLQRCKDYFRREFSESSGGGNEEVTPEPLESRFDRVVNTIFTDLCNDEEVLWYRSARLWYELEHRDRGRLLLLGSHASDGSKQPTTINVLQDSSVLTTKE